MPDETHLPRRLPGDPTWEQIAFNKWRSAYIADHWHADFANRFWDAARIAFAAGWAAKPPHVCTTWATFTYMPTVCAECGAPKNV